MAFFAPAERRAFLLRISDIKITCRQDFAFIKPSAHILYKLLKKAVRKENILQGGFFAFQTHIQHRFASHFANHS